MKIAKATQKPGQTKEQTKLISQGIEKGIALYKKQQKEKARQAERAKKKAQRTKRSEQETIENTPPEHQLQENEQSKNAILPWALLVISWIGFAVYIMQNQ